MKRILAVSAHPDDIEIMAGGSLLKWKDEGMEIHALIVTDGSGISPEGTPIRLREDALREQDAVSKIMQYDTCEVLGEKSLYLTYKDEVVCEILRRIKQYGIDTILTCWDKDTHRDHAVVAQMAKMAGRHVPNFLMGQINYYIHDFYCPNVYVDISDYWDKKLQTCRLFSSAWKNHDKDWYDFLNSTATYFGRIVATDKAEGFIASKLLI